jgi:hypothetical protein
MVDRKIASSDTIIVRRPKGSSSRGIAIHRLYQTMVK